MLFLAILAAAGLACSFTDELVSEVTPATPTAIVSEENVDPPAAAPEPTQTQPDPTTSPTPAESAAATKPATTVEPTVESTALEPEPRPNSKVRPEQLDSFERLATGEPPERDDLELARLYGGWDGALSPPAAVTEPLAVGTVQQLRILNHDDITFSTTPFELLAVSDHAYFWFSDGPTADRIPADVLEQTGRNFDQIYEQSVAIFGPEDSPGVDGDPRLHIVNAAPDRLCADAGACGLAGYFSGDDVLPAEVDPDSNNREMFVMNADYFGSDFYLNVLTHELRHMIEDNYDRGDDAWEGEGAAMLAEDLLGYPDNAVGRANRFLAQPDQQLNAWTDGDTIPYYGMGYLLNRYIYDRLGPELYRQFGASHETGLAAIDQVAAANDLALTGHDLWLDWLVAMALIGQAEIPDEYEFGVAGLDSPDMQIVDRFPAAFDETVHQYAADFFRLLGDEQVTINFAGSELVPVLDSQPYSGQAMWLADRANNSHARLTRAIDLSTVEAASLEYSVYHDIEAGYDFAYLFVSEDDGQSWQPLVAENMQGVESDPSDSALAERFYSGRSDEWRRELVDLTPYAGQEILIRFAYLTDMVLTFGGLAVDDIAIPEIGFSDDGETDVAGWTAEGFERVTGSIPQQWQLLMITFPDGRPSVERLNVAADQTLAHSLDLFDSDGEAILIVSAWAPTTLQPAGYHLEFAAP